MQLALPSEILAAPVNGVNLVPGSLADQIGPGPTLLVFLRHFGCIFCRETVSELRRTREADPAFPRVLFFFQGSPTVGRAFLRRFWPEARAVADPDKGFYGAFGIGRGGLAQLFGPGVWSAARRARKKGISQGPRAGDVWMMPGVFLIRDGHIVWAHEYAHAGDQPDFACIPEAAGLQS
jgi:hypothetical protein